MVWVLTVLVLSECIIYCSEARNIILEILVAFEYPLSIPPLDKVWIR